MEVLVPFSTDRPKSRLAGVLESDERAAFARRMLEDVVRAVRTAGGDPHLLATDDVEPPAEIPVTVDTRPLTEAVNAALDRHDPTETGPVGIVMADLALATPDALRRLFASDADVAIAPGRGGGTNALVVRHPAFRVDYHGASYLDHRRIAGEADASVAVVDSHRLATDIDEPADLAELLIHGDGGATAWLRDTGVVLDDANGRVGVTREE